MGYLIRNQYGVVTVNDEASIHEPKKIRFITPDYKELFHIADGDQILISYQDGTKKAMTCQYLDDYHLLVGHNAFHICEFAERMEQIGAHVEPFPEKHMIWSNTDLDLKDWEELRKEYPDYDERQLTEKMYEIAGDYLDDERANLSIQCGTDIIVFGDIGRWDGRVQGYKIIESGKLSDCLSADCDYAEWYVDREGELRSRQIHHDGTNYLYYRKFKDGLSYDDRDNFLDKFCSGKATQAEIDRVTEKLGETVGKVYGWNFPTEKQNNREYERG